MLIAPLMRPIVSLGMGLASGSPYLVLRATTRILLSVLATVACSAALTRLLPFHELTAAIAARTNPTALDLLVAAFCALAGVYAAVQESSDAATTAAGTSIGISLVPPLCVSGYGLGTGLWGVAGGAALLFLTNVVAIVFVATVAFAASGFNQVDLQASNREEEKNVRSGMAAFVADRLEGLFASRYGSAARLLMPFALLAAVFVPLQHALEEVAWQIRVRNDVNVVLAGLSEQVVESRTRVERGEIEISLVLLGSTADAQAVKTRVDGILQQSAGVVPKIDVRAIPDATAFAGLEAALRRPVPALPVASAPEERLDAARALVQAALAERWPSRSAGRILESSIVLAEPLGVSIVHLGPGLDAPARETLEGCSARISGGRSS